MNGMKLIIVESPAKTKTISKYLGKGFEVHASVGHIRDLPKNNKKAIDIEGGFIPNYETVKGKEKVIKEIQKLALKAEEVYLATDPDREGEAIAWHVKEACKLKSPKRIVFYEITEPAVKEALTHPREIDENLRRAQEARRVLDRIVGYDLSGLIWKKVRYGLSAGRVQSPALRILSEREREIRAFIPETFWVISGEFKTEKEETILLVCEREPREREEAESIIESAKNGKWHVIGIKKTEVKRSPKPPFTTSTLQQAANSVLGISPAQTMRIAQKLYEAGLITYMRTDSTTISATVLPTIYKEIEKRFGKEYLSPRTYSTKSKNAQEAHESVRPTDVASSHAGDTEEQKALYRLIWERTIASQMADAQTLRTKVLANIMGKNSSTADKIPDFSATGSILLFKGWLAAGNGISGADILPDISEGERLILSEIHEEEKRTEPPNRYTEAGLVKELEKRGIGRPSTYASIIKTLQDRGYAEKIGRSLTVTDTGEVVNDFLEKHFPTYISDTFTAEMEDELDEIALGKRDYVKSLSDFYIPFAKEVKSKEKVEKATNLGDAPAEFKCPVCNGDMIVKLARTGKFLSCKKFPDCVGARKFDGSEMALPKETGEACPKCGKGKLMEREGRFGKFICCSTYPKCKYVKESEEEAAKRKTGVMCPDCSKGEIMERKGRFGLFYSCSNYPDCKFIMKSKPTGKKCAECGALMMEGTKTIPERCSNRACPNHNPHKKTAK